MYSKAKLLKILSRDQPSMRYDTCEYINAIQESSPERVAALEKTILDLDPKVAERAKQALVVGLKKSIALANLHINKSVDKLTHPSSLENNHFEEPNDAISRVARPSMTMLVCQSITFFSTIIFSALSLAIIFTSLATVLMGGPLEFYNTGVCGWILISMFLIYIALQIYATRKYGFRASFFFLKLVLRFL
jgi:hypothetical protein